MCSAAHAQLISSACRLQQWLQPFKLSEESFGRKIKRFKIKKRTPTTCCGCNNTESLPPCRPLTLATSLLSRDMRNEPPDQARCSHSAHGHSYLVCHIGELWHKGKQPGNPSRALSGPDTEKLDRSNTPSTLRRDVARVSDATFEVN